MKTFDMDIMQFNANGICVGCISEGRKLCYSDKIKECYKLLANINIPDDQSIQVCWECMAYINNIFKFKNTIERSYGLLYDYSKKHKLMNNLADVYANARQRLQAVTVETMPCLIENELPVEFLETEYLEQDEDFNNCSLDPETEVTDSYQLDDDLNSRTESESVYNWTQDETFLLIHCYEKEGVHLLKEKKDVSVALHQCVASFNNILSEKVGKTIPLSKCISKIHCLKRVYRQKLKMKNKSRKIRVAWPYFQVLHELFQNQYGERKYFGETESNLLLVPDCSEDMVKKEPSELKTADTKLETVESDEKPIPSESSQKTHGLSPLIPDTKVQSKKRVVSKPLKCEFCTLKFDKRKDLMIHQKRHGKKKMFSCKYCSYKSDRNYQLKIHESTHTGEKPFKCKYCPRKFCGSTQLKCHTYTHTGEKPFACDQCSFKCRIHSSLKKHKINKHSEQRPFNCNMCPYSCAARFELVYHMRKHTGEKPYICEFCSYRSTNSNGLRVHMTTHSDEKPFSCEVCAYKCKSKARLKLHMCKHTGEKKYGCKICTFKCVNKANLKIHINRVHCKEKPFVCEVCSYRCAGKFDLIVHSRRHTGEKPYFCEFCSYRCTTSGALRRHVRTHTGETPHSCDICSFKCSTKMKLKVHMCKHTGEKLFTCEFCPYQCNDKSKLKIHIRRLHTIKKP